MATYYVRPDGNDSNTGLGSSVNLAWRTVQKALGATGITVGDTVYIAPGVYRESITASFTNPTSEAQRVTIAGNPTASQFTGVSSGPVIITSYSSSTATTGSQALILAKSYVTLRDVYITGYTTGGSGTYGAVANFTGNSCIISNCGFYTPVNNVDVNAAVTFESEPNQIGFTISKCVFYSPVRIGGGSYTPTAQWNSQTTITNCIFINPGAYIPTACLLFYSPYGAYLGGVTVQNCRFVGNTGIAPYPSNNMSTTFPIVVRNCIFETSIGMTASLNNNQFVQSYNIFNCGTSLTNVASGTGSVSRAFISTDFNLSRITGFANYPFFANHPLSASQNAGTSTGAPTTDMFGINWSTPTTPSLGSVEYANNEALGQYNPIERNESIYTVAQGSTSQTIELYLGVTGLTPTTTGLVAHYVRSKSAPVQIPLVAQTPTGSWVSGGFCQISASNVPGLYRLDVPDAAFAQGAENVTIYVRGAAGSNGAVVDVSMSYPVTAQMVRMGPYKLISNHMGADNPLEVLKGVQAPVDVQLVDNSGGGIDITGASVTAKVYNASSQLIDTYTCTPTYALDGRCSFNLDTTVTDNSGHYTVTVTRQVGGNIVVFGPLRCLVRAN